MHTCVLFVDDEPLILSLYEALSPDLGPDFTVKTARGGREALDVLAETPVQIVVSDLEMPEMAGGELLTLVEKRYPDAMRVVISGYDDELHVAKCLTFGHRYLRKPVEPENLANTLKRLSTLRQSLSARELKQLLSEYDSVPAPPETYLRLSEALQAGTGSEEFAEIITGDPILSERLLQVVNSGAFGLAVPIETVQELFDVVGVHVVRALILGLHTKDFFAPRTPNAALFESLWEHSLQTASYARKLASVERQGFRECQTAYVAGLLHDIGKFMIAAYAGRNDGGELGLADCGAILGVSHAAIGAYLLGLWGLPESIVTTAELHHSLELVPSHAFSPILYVHAGQNLGIRGRSAGLDLTFIEKVGKSDRISAWAEVLSKHS